MHKRLGLTLFAGLAIFVSACSGGGSSAAPSAAASAKAGNESAVSATPETTVATAVNLNITVSPRNS